MVVQLLGAGPHATQVCLTSFPRSPLKHMSSCCTLATCHWHLHRGCRTEPGKGAGQAQQMGGMRACQAGQVGGPKWRGGFPLGAVRVGQGSPCSLGKG